MKDISYVLGGVRNEIANIPWDVYTELPALNPSTIVHGVRSMKHLKYNWDNSRPDTPALQWGRAVHCMLFEPSEFPKRYRAWTGRRAGTEYKEFLNEVWAYHAEVLADTGRYSLESAMEAATEIVKDPLVQKLIAAGRPETTVFATEGNVQCRGRLDWISTSENRIVDLKTARTSDTRLFGRDFYKYHYDIKLGLYRRWLNKLTSKTWPVEIIVAESEPPYDVVVVPIPDAVLDRGARIGCEIIARVEDCIKTDCWPGSANGDYGTLDTPAWEMDDEEELVAFEE